MVRPLCWSLGYRASRPRLVIVKNFKVFLLQIAHQVALMIANHNGEQDFVNVQLNGWSCIVRLTGLPDGSLGLGKASQETQEESQVRPMTRTDPKSGS